MASTIAVPIAGALVSIMLLMAVRSLLPKGYLVAAVTARSNHQHAARQIGGFAVVPAMLAAIFVAIASGAINIGEAAAFASAAILLFACGVVDDARNLAPPPKFALQVLAAGIAIWWLAETIVPSPDGIAPLLRMAATGVLLVWAVNLTNFMDGIDLIVVAGIGVPASIIGIAGLAGFAETTFPVVLAMALGAALLPFAVANKPPASMFLGDNGSLPTGLAAGCIALGLWAQYSLAAGLLPFAYFLVDSTATLVWRAVAGKNIFAAHSEHAYQIAKRKGLSALAISLRVAAVSILTATLAIVSASQYLPGLAAILIGYGAAIALYVMFVRGR